MNNFSLMGTTMTTTRFTLGLMAFASIAVLAAACGESDGDSGSPTSTSTTGGGGAGATGGGGTGGEGGEFVPDCTNGEEEQCFDGEMAQIGVGICREGTRVCADDVWGACAGDHVPPAMTDDCQLIEDEDCDGIACANTEWARHGWAAQDFQIVDQVIGTDGSIYAVGFSDGDGNFGGANVPTTGVTIVIAQFNDIGDPVWMQLLADSPDHKRALAVAIDPTDGNLIVGGTMRGPIDLGGGALTPFENGTDDIWLGRFSALTGAHIDSRVGTPRPTDVPQIITSSPTGPKRIFDIHVAGDGTIFTTGMYFGDWGCVFLVNQCVPEFGTPTPDLDGYFRVYDSDFNNLIMRAFSGVGTNRLDRVIAHPNGGVIVHGWHFDDAMVGNITLPGRGAYVAQLSNTGDVQFVTAFPGGDQQAGLFINNADEIVYSNFFDATPLVIGQDTYDPGTNKGGFVAKLGLDGTVITHVALHGANGDMVFADSIGGPDDTIYVAGRYKNDMDLFGTALEATMPDQERMLWFKLDTNLQLLGHKIYDGTASMMRPLNIDWHPKEQLVVGSIFTNGTINVTGTNDSTSAHTHPQYDTMLYMMQP